jgi:diguanylate cyclase (GGDEF)-like protein
VGAAALAAWPLLMLAGLRRFHPRQPFHGSAELDLGIGGCSLLAHAAALGAADEVTWAPALAVLALWLGHGYMATVVLTGPARRAFAPALALAGTGVLLALAVAAGTLAWGSAALPSLLLGAGTLGGLASALSAMTLMGERTEQQLRDSRRRLRALANLDTLTQVPNRRHFQELADRALRRDEPGSAAMLIFDIDHFKRINDLFGHAAGDRALCLVSAAVLEHLRADDVPGRHGGDEFVLLLRRTSPNQAMNVAARIVAEVQRRAPQQQLPTLTLSFGVVQIGLGEGVPAALRRADQALYEAKRQGRARVVAAAGDEDEPVFWESRPLGLTPL